MPAHKFLLALASPVFRRCFFGEFKEKKVIDMEHTTLSAFKAMMEVLYKGSIDYKKMSASDIMELVNLAERYDLPKLKNKLKQQLEDMVIKKENVVEVAKTAMKFCHLEEVSLTLLDTCAKTLARELETKESVVKFFSSFSGTGDEEMVLKLMKMLDALMAPRPCPNCQQMPCKSGRGVTSVQEVRAGTKLEPNPVFVRYSGIGSWGEAVEVMSTTEFRMKVDDSGVSLPAMVNGISVFNYCCEK